MSVSADDLRRAVLAGLSDGKAHPRADLLRHCRVEKYHFDAQLRELTHLGLLRRDVNERVRLTPIGYLHLPPALAQHEHG